MNRVGKFNKRGSTITVHVSSILFNNSKANGRVHIAADGAEENFIFGRVFRLFDKTKYKKVVLMNAGKQKAFEVEKTDDCCAAICFYLGQEVTQ